MMKDLFSLSMIEVKSLLRGISLPICGTGTTTLKVLIATLE